MRLVPVLLAAAAVAACNVSGAASGERVQRDVQAAGFESIALSAPHDVAVSVGGPHGVRLDGDSGLIDRTEIRVEDGVLRIGQREGASGWGDDDRRVTVHVTLPALKAVSLAGSGDIRVDRVEGETFAASLSGSGDIDIGDLRVAQARLAIAGSGDIEAAGAADSLEASIAGSGDLDADGLRVRRARLGIAGSGDARLHASETAEISLLGSGNAEVAGGARCTVNTRGSGEARCG